MRLRESAPHLRVPARTWFAAVRGVLPRLAAAGILIGWHTAIARAEAIEESPSAAVASLDSGREVGDTVPTFYSRVVTGPLMNRSVCYVCRNGNRPVIMVLLREVNPKIRPLLRNIDRIIERRRGAGVRSFGVLLSDDPFRSISTVQTFAFNARVEMPLTVATDAVAIPSCQNVHSDAAVTIVMYQKREVVSRIAFRDDELTMENFRDVVRQVQEFAGDHEPLHTTRADDTGAK